MTDTSEMTLDVLLDFVKRTRGFDFTGYKRSDHRAPRRASGWASSASSGYEDYIDHLEVDPERVRGALQHDPHQRHRVLPRRRRPGSTSPPTSCRSCIARARRTPAAHLVRGLRVRGGGLHGRDGLRQALGEAAFLERVKIYATDVDEEALDQARHGAYPARRVEDVPREALERFFERPDQRYTFRRDLRRAVIFGRNDLVQDAPISRIDLLVCRNTLMYFNAETQARILRRFHFALDDEGVLVLGKSEMLITHADLFRPADLKRRIFDKVVRPDDARPRPRHGDGPRERPGAGARRRRCASGAYDLTRSAQVVIDRDGTLAMANDHARRMLGLDRRGRRAADPGPRASPTGRSSCGRGWSGSPRTASRSRSRACSGGRRPGTSASSTCGWCP